MMRLREFLVVTALVVGMTALSAAREAPGTPGSYAKPTVGVAPAPRAYFDWFEYKGRDAAFDEGFVPPGSPLPPGSYRNPVLAGFYPDPSITRAGDKFYLVNSTFTYYPGIPVFESDDLVHWRQIGNVIDRPHELSFDHLNVSRGLFAPTIRFHKGLFYVVCTAVDAGGNFLSIARNPAGPWSDPIWLANIDGIDPSLFFDDDGDGKVYLLNNGLPEGGPRYEGHRAIWIQQIDLASRKTFGPRKVLVNGGVDIASKPVWIEGPHLYRRNGWYYLMCAEGGTSDQHSEVIFRSRSPWGPFKPYRDNPILTQRDLPQDRPYAIANSGHADLIEATDGQWWAVFLASRTYEGVHYNTGRETYLLPVTWRDGWPSILTPRTQIPYIVVMPDGDKGSGAGKGPAAATSSAEPLTGNFTWRDDFTSATLQPAWLNVRVPKQPWADLSNRPGWLTIHALRTPLESLENMSFLARRQQHLAFDASTELELPEKPGVSLGLAAFQNENYWYFFGVRRLRAGAGVFEVFLEKRAGKQTDTIASAGINTDTAVVRLRISADSRAYSFYYSGGESGKDWLPLKENDDGTILSTDVAGGFVGAFVGPYARAE